MQWKYVTLIIGGAVGTVGLGFLMEPLFPLGDWRWAVVVVLGYAPAMFAWRKEIKEGALGGYRKGIRPRIARAHRVHGRVGWNARRWVAQWQQDKREEIANLERAKSILRQFAPSKGDEQC